MFDKIKLSNGKYEAMYNDKTCYLECKRYGEKWLELELSKLEGGNMIYSLFAEAMDMRKKIEDLEKYAKIGKAVEYLLSKNENILIAEVPFGSGITEIFNLEDIVSMYEKNK